MEPGYQDDFLEAGNDALRVPLPSFDKELTKQLFSEGTPHTPTVIKKRNFSLLMNEELRSAAVVALNIRQDHLQSGIDGGDWDFDADVPELAQLGEPYYGKSRGFDNEFDRGHLAPHASAAWGKPRAKAKEASDQTYVFTNSTLQHKNLNRDEWRELEEWVRTSADANGQRLSVMVGPIYGLINMSVRPLHRPAALAPSGYFKIMAFRHRDAPDQLSVRAFIIQQSLETIRDQSGWRPKLLQSYQVSVTQIEKLTGLRFADAIKAANPMFFSDSPASEAAGVLGVPEMKLVSIDQHIVDMGQRRDDVASTTSKVFFCAALMNPKGRSDKGEWVSVINLGSSPADLGGWVFMNQDGKTAQLNQTLDPGETKKLAINGVKLPNKAGQLTLLQPVSSGDGVRMAIVDEVFVRSKEVKTQGLVIPFLAKRFS